MKKVFYIGLIIGLLWGTGVSQIHAANTSFDVTLDVTDSTPPPPTATTTTPVGNGMPVGVQNGPQGSEGFGPLEIIGTRVIPGVSSAEISWRTTENSSAVIRWGKTSAYGTGSITLGEALSQRTVIPNLEPGTQYFFIITATDRRGRTAVDENETFTTRLVSNSVPNAQRFLASQVGNSVLLTWDSPSFSGFESVQIVRSERFFPEDPLDGEIVYEGRENRFQDTGVSLGRDYFYTLFVKTSDGRFSSGAIAGISLPLPGQEEPEKVPEPASSVLIDLVIRRWTPTASSSGVGFGIDLADFTFRDGLVDLRMLGGRMVVTQGHFVTVSLSAGKLPDGVKTVLVTLNGELGSESFVLRLNGAKTAYEATFSVGDFLGERIFSARFFGYDSQLQKTALGIFDVIQEQGENSPFFIQFFWIPIILIILISILLLLAIFWKKLYTLLRM